MVKKVSTRRRNDQEDGLSNSIFDQFSQQEMRHDPDEPQDGKLKGEVDVAALMKQIADLNNRVELSERTNMALMSQPVIPSQSFQTQPQHQQQEEQAPDPTLDPAGYGKYVQAQAKKTIDDFMADQRRSQENASTEKQQADQIWNSFSSKYEDYSEDQERIEYVAGLVLKDAKAMGIDPKRYMTSAQDKFFSDITTRYDKVFGKPGDEEDSDNAEITTSNRRTQTQEPASRTAGIFGGMESSGRPNKGADQPSDFIKELQSTQLKNGFY